MPQFFAGETRTAKLPMKNPTSRSFDYRGQIYMGTDLAEVSEQLFHLNAGEERQIGFPVTMPGTPGTYPVHVGLFSEGKNIGLYRAEDIVLNIPDPLEIVDGWWTPVSFYFPEPFWRTITASQCTVVVKNNTVNLAPDEQAASILSGFFIMPLLKPYRTPWGNVNQFAFGPYDSPGLPAAGQHKDISVTIANTDLLNLLDNGYVTTGYEGLAAQYQLLVFWQQRGIVTKDVELRRA